MRYNRQKFKDLEAMYDMAHNSPATFDTRGEQKLIKELDSWSIEDLQDEMHWYRDAWKPSNTFMAYLDYYIKKRINKDTDTDLF